MKLSPRLSFNGQCREAMDFYERCFGAKIQFSLTYGNSPMSDHVPPAWRRQDSPRHARHRRKHPLRSRRSAGPISAPKGFSRDDRRPRRCRSRAHLQRAFRRRHRAVAAPKNLLGHPLRRAGRSLWHTVGSKLPASAGMNASVLGRYWDAGLFALRNESLLSSDLPIRGNGTFTRYG